MTDESELNAEEKSLLKSFWNAVVRNRKLVKQAKIHLINKLTKQVKKYGDKDPKKKESLVDQISATKTLFPDDVTKFCFLRPVDELQQHFKTATTKDDLAKIKLCLTKPLRNATQDFQTTFPEWGNIGVLLEEHKRFRKKKTPKNKKRSKDSGLLENSETKEDPRFGPGEFNEEEFSEFRPPVSEKDDSDSSVSGKINLTEKSKELKNQLSPPSCARGGSEALEVMKGIEDCETGTATLKSFSEMKPKVLPMKSANRSKLDISPEVSAKNKDCPATLPSGLKREQNKKRKNSDTIRTKSSSFTVESNEDVVSSCHRSDASQPIEKKAKRETSYSKPNNVFKDRPDSLPSPPPETTLTVDPFFITPSEQGYLTHATLDKPPESDHGRFEKTFKTNNRYSSNGGPRNRRERRAMERNPAGGVSLPIKKPRSDSDRFKPSPGVVGEKLHPSWQAKKSLAPKIMPFQGRKVVFE